MNKLQAFFLRLCIHIKILYHWAHYLYVEAKSFSLEIKPFPGIKDKGKETKDHISMRSSFRLVLLQNGIWVLSLQVQTMVASKPNTLKDSLFVYFIDSSLLLSNK